MFKQVVGHASYIGHTGFANHSREFFTALNKKVPVRVRNFAHAADIDYLTQEQKDMIVEMEWAEPPWKVGTPFEPIEDMVDVVLVETNHYYFYDEYKNKAKVAYNIWESTRQPEQFFQQLMTFDQFWAPSEWQVRCTIEQGFPAENAKVVPCAVDGSVFKPVLPEHRQQDKFRFLLFGRWDYRKSTTEIIRAFLATFEPHEQVELVCSIDNGWPTPDGLTDTDSRLKEYGFYNDPRLKIVPFVSFSDYVKYLQNGHVFLSCARSEGWNLPLLEAIACGIPTICSDYGAQLEFAKGISHTVRIVDHKSIPDNIFIDQDVPGTWAEPDYVHLREVMRDLYENYADAVAPALKAAKQVSEKFTYEAAAQKGMECLSELYDKDPVLVNTKLKLNLGCGDTKLSGFVNIDLYNDYGEPDKQLDARNTPYGQDSVDAIHSTHMLEHVGHREVESTLRHWLDILKPGGELELHVPDFVYNVSNWLAANKVERQQHALQQIFGRQTGDGELHKTGFSQESIYDALDSAGFGSIEVESEWAYKQNCLKVTANKKTSVGREIVIMSAFADTPEKETVLRECFNRIKSVDIPIALVTHHRPRPELVELFDYVIYERENVLSEGWELNYWFNEPKVIRILGKYGANSYQPVAILSSLRMAVNALRERYDTAYFIESDTMVNFVDYVSHTRKALINGAKLVAFTYDNDLDDLGTNILAFDTKWFDNALPDIRSWQEYLDLSDQMRVAGMYNGDAIFEFWFPAWLKYNNLWDKCHVHSRDIKISVMSRENVIQRDLKHDVKVDISETNDGRLVVFLANYRDTQENVPCIVYRDSVEVYKSELCIGSVGWFVIPKQLSTLDIWLDDDESVYKLNIDPNHDYSGTTFKFYHDELVCKSWNGGDFGPVKEDVNVGVSFITGAKVELSGTSTKDYQVEFIDTHTNQVVHSGAIQSGFWIAPSVEYLVDWQVRVSKDGDCVTDTKFDLTGQRVLLALDSKSLGDNVAWFPYCAEFARVRQCSVIVSTFWNEFFVDAYPTLEFVEPGSTVENIYAVFNIGCYDDNDMKNKNNWRTIPIQQIASDMLGLPATELRPRLGMDIGVRPIKDKYVCVSEHSTMQAKYWNYPGGWQSVVEELKSRGYVVVAVSRESTQLKGVRRRTGQTIESTINTLAYAEAFLGVSSGPAWLAWALKVPVVMVSGISEQFNEFKSDMARVINEDVCHGCANDPEYLYARGDWAWCPRNKDFECTKTITPQDVMTKFDWLMSDERNEDLFYTPDQADPVHLSGINTYPTFGYSYDEIFNGKAYEHEGCKVEPGDVVVDIGANIGVFTKYALKMGASQVYSFEPDPDNYKALVSNSNGNEAQQTAVTDSIGMSELHLHECRGGHSLVGEQENSDSLGRSVEVSTTTLPCIMDSYHLNYIDYLKIDTEGSELAIFKGCSDDDLMKVNKIGMEYHNMLYGFNTELREGLTSRLVNLGFQPMTLFLGESEHLQMLYFWRPSV